MSGEAELAKMWTLFPPDRQAPIHLRAIWPKGVQSSRGAKNLIFTSGEYTSLCDRKKAFSDSALSLNASGYNIYTCFNPILPGHTESSVNDQDIAVRTHLLIDIDRAEMLAASATDAEIEEAEKLADKVASFLHEKRGLLVDRVMSGNGVHLYVPLDSVPNDDTSKEHCKQLLRGLAHRFDNDIVKIDTTVFNAARITKVPGTIMRKGAETADRPYRMARVI